MKYKCRAGIHFTRLHIAIDRSQLRIKLMAPYRYVGCSLYRTVKRNQYLRIIQNRNCQPAGCIIPLSMDSISLCTPSGFLKGDVNRADICSAILQINDERFLRAIIPMKKRVSETSPNCTLICLLSCASTHVLRRNDPLMLTVPSWANSSQPPLIPVRTESRLSVSTSLLHW